MSHHIFTSGGAAHDVELLVAHARSPSLVLILLLMSLHTPMKTLLMLSILLPLLYRGVVELWRLLPVRPFRSEKEAVRTVKQYAVRQGFAVSIAHTQKNKIARHQTRIYLCCFQGMHYQYFHGRLVSLLDRETKTVCGLCELAITFNKDLLEIDTGRHLNNCYYRYVRRINDIKLVAHDVCHEKEDIRMPQLSRCIKL